MMNPMYPMYGGYNYPINPFQPQQQRLAEMEQQYQFNQNQNSMNPMNPMNNNMSQNFMKCRAVTSIDEAKASMIDLDGSIHVFTDIGNKRIYTKQINLDGTATLKTYTLQETPETPPPAPVAEPVNLDGYVKQEELESVCRSFAQQLDELQDQLKGYERAFAMMQEEKAKPATKTGGKK